MKQFTAKDLLIAQTHFTRHQQSRILGSSWLSQNIDEVRGHCSSGHRTVAIGQRYSKPENPKFWLLMYHNIKQIFILPMDEVTVAMQMEMVFFGAQVQFISTSIFHVKKHSSNRDHQAANGSMAKAHNHVLQGESCYLFFPETRGFPMRCYISLSFHGSRSLVLQKGCYMPI